MSGGPGAGGRPVVVLASTAYHGHQLYDQRLARELAGRGPVLYVDPPRQLLGLARAPEVRATPVGRAPDVPGLALLTPAMLPLGGRRWLAPLTALGVLAALVVTLARRRTTPSAVVVLRAHPLVLRGLRRWPTVHVVKDDYVAGAELLGQSPRRLAAQLRARLRHAEHVAVVSPVLRTSLLRRGVRAVVVPGGCEIPTGRAAEPAELRDVGPRRAVFIGMLSDRIDFAQLAAVVAAGTELVVVGREQHTFTRHAELAALRASGRLHLLGERGPAELLAVLQHCSVGLIPYEVTEFNRASFPLKTLEYLAAGLPVVGSDLPGLRWLGGTGQVVRVSGAAEFGAAVAAAATASQDPATAQACVELASHHTWAARADQLVGMVHPRG